MTSTFKLGTRVSLAFKDGKNVESDTFFVVASDGLMYEGKYFLVYHKDGAVHTTAASPESLIFELPPVKWERGTTPPLWAVGRYKLKDAIVIDELGSSQLQVLVIDGRETVTVSEKYFAHPDDADGVLEFGQRVLVNNTIAHIVKYHGVVNGLKTYTVALPQIGDSTKGGYANALQAVSENEFEIISPEFKPNRPVSLDEISFGDIIYNVLALGTVFEIEAFGSTQTKCPIVTQDGEIYMRTMYEVGNGEEEEDDE